MSGFRSGLEGLALAVRLLLIALYTGVLGTTGILLCLVVPGGTALMPLARLWSWLVLRTCAVRSTASRHRDFNPLRPCIYVANHQSLFDIPALVLAMPTDFRMVAKRELRRIPIFGWALWLAGFVFIDRADRDSAIRSLDRAAGKLKRGISIVVFAEGTRSRDGRLLPFKKGGFVLALQARAPIVPVSIHGGREVLPKGSLKIKAGAIDVVFGAPVDTSSYSYDSREVLIEEVRRRILSGLEPQSLTRTAS